MTQHTLAIPPSHPAQIIPAISAAQNATAARICHHFIFRDQVGQASRERRPACSAPQARVGRRVLLSSCSGGEADPRRRGYRQRKTRSMCAIGVVARNADSPSTNADVPRYGDRVAGVAPGLRDPLRPALPNCRRMVCVLGARQDRRAGRSSLPGAADRPAGYQHACTCSDSRPVRAARAPRRRSAASSVAFVLGERLFMRSAYEARAEEARQIERTIVQGTARLCSSPFGDACKGIWKFKTAETIAARLRCAPRTIAYELSGEREPSARSIALLIAVVTGREPP